VAQQADETLNVLFTGEEDFFPGDGGLPKLTKCFFLIFAQQTLVNHETLRHQGLLHLLQLSSGGCAFREELAARVLAVDE